MIDNVRNKGEKHQLYELKQWKKRIIRFFNDISDHVTLVQLMDTTVNVNHDESIT